MAFDFSLIRKKIFPRGRDSSELLGLREGERIDDDMCILWERPVEPAVGARIVLKDLKGECLPAEVVSVFPRPPAGPRGKKTFDIQLKVLKTLPAD